MSDENGVAHKTVQGWLDALSRSRPVRAQDDVWTRRVGFQGSDGIVHSIGLSDLKAGLHEMTLTMRELIQTPGGRQQLYDKEG